MGILRINYQNIIQNCSFCRSVHHLHIVFSYQDKIFFKIGTDKKKLMHRHGARYKVKKVFLSEKIFYQIYNLFFKNPLPYNSR